MEGSFNRDIYLSTIEGTFIPDYADIIEALGLAVDEKSSITPEDFACNICMALVYDPYACNRCDQMFCKVCVDAWKKSGSQVCPCCKQLF
jgi:hypothetical protein